MHINKVLLSIPAKNEALTLKEVITTNQAQILHTTGLQADVLVINDGSTDYTSQIATECGATVIEHHRSKGLGYSFGEAIEYAVEHNYDLLVTVDGDNQFSPTDIPSLLAPILNNEADFVSGSRFLSSSHITNIPKVKYCGNKIMSWLVSSILEESFKDVSCGFRAYNKEAIYNLNTFGKFTYTQEVFLNLGVKKIRIKEIPISVIYYHGRKSRIAYNISLYALQTLKIIFRSVISYKPMRLFGTISVIIFIITIPIIAILGVRYLITDLITPFKGIAIASIILLVIGFTSLTAGLILEIMSRIQLNIEKAIYYARKK